MMTRIAKRTIPVFALIVLHISCYFEDSYDITPDAFTPIIAINAANGFCSGCSVEYSINEGRTERIAAKPFEHPSNYVLDYYTGYTGKHVNIQIPSSVTTGSPYNQASSNFSFLLSVPVAGDLYEYRTYSAGPSFTLSIGSWNITTGWAQGTFNGILVFSDDGGATQISTITISGSFITRIN